MIDFEAVDRMFDATKDLPFGPVRFALFDKTALLSLDQLVEAVAGETGEACTIEFLQKKAAEGWFPLLPRPGAPRRDGRPDVRAIAGGAVRSA